MKFFLSTIFAVTFISYAAHAAPAEDASEALAREECSKLHQNEVIERTKETGFLNNRCLLNCAINGRVWTHFLAEGEPCPQTGTGYCYSGSCQSAPPTGHIDVEIESVSVAVPSGPVNLQVTACIQNQTTSGSSVKLPLADHSTCISCATPVAHGIYSAGWAYWGQVCRGAPSSSLFNELATVTFEVWETVGQFETNKVFLGGVRVSVPEMANEHSSGKLLHLPLKDGHLAGQLSTRITWTPNE